MSVRDLRAFLSGHKTGLHHTTNEADRLPHQFLTRDTRPPKRYRATDYDQLLATANQHRSTASESLRRVEKLSKVGRRSKESSLLKQHKEAWGKKQAQLLDAGRRAQLELESWRSAAVLREKGGVELEEFLSEVAEYDAILFEDREVFREQTVEPLWELRVDLKQWMQDTARPETHYSAGSHQDVLKELAHVKQQQQQIWKRLGEEYEAVYSQLKPLNSTLCSQTADLVIDRGIPTELEGLKWPDPQLKATALREFNLLDDNFQATLQLWKEKNIPILNETTGGWNEMDAERFALLKEQYPRDGSGHQRKLFIDRVTRELPHKQRTEIVAHEGWSNALAHYHTQRRSYLKLWQQHRKELQDRVAAINQATWEAHKLEGQARSSREEQQRRCQKLFEKVSRWREEKLEALKVESEQAARVRQEAEARERIEKEKLEALRKRKQTEIAAYHSELTAAREEEEERVKRLAKEVEKEREKGARSARERVVLRQEGWGERLAQLKAEEDRMREEEEQREKRLELLRKQVEVNVSTDPIRVLRETKASAARGKMQSDVELELQRPLFPVHSFPADKLTSDPRFKVEAALRKAGLHTTGYARRLLAAIPPPQPPRPDQHSTIFKHN